MTDIREEFEVAVEACILETQCMLEFDEDTTRDIAWFIWQAATLAQQKKVEALEIQVQELREALCKATRSLYGMQVPKYYSDLIDETFTPTHLQV